MSVQQQLPAITRNLEALETLLVTRQQRLTGTGLDNPDTNDKTIKRRNRSETYPAFLCLCTAGGSRGYLACATGSGVYSDQFSWHNN